MDTSFLKPLYDQRGPWCSVYLSTARDEPQAEHAIELRWRDLRGRLAELGAPARDLRAVDGEVGSDRGVPGRHGQALFAAHGAVALARELRAPVTGSIAVYGELPDLVPLLAASRDLGPHVLVFVDHSGADVEVHGRGSEPADERVDGPQDRHRRRAESTWQDNARAVAARVGQIAKEHAAGVVALSGDARMRAAVLAELGPPWRSRAVELSGSDSAGADTEAVRRQAARDAAEFEQSWRAGEVDRYAAGLANGKAVEGLEPTVAMLRQGEVDTLLVRHDSPQAAAQVWWGPEVGHLSLDPDELAASRAPRVKRGRAVDALIRGAALADSSLLLFSGHEPGPAEAFGAILRRG
jgi:hypothetical protein